MTDDDEMMILSVFFSLHRLQLFLPNFSIEGHLFLVVFLPVANYRVFFFNVRAFNHN